MALFTPVGEKPKWELVYQELLTLNIGDTLGYERLQEILGIEGPAARERSRGPFYKAVSVWGAERKRAMRPVPNVGYLVVDAPEHEAIAKSQHRRSRRALQRSRTALSNADRSRLSLEERRRFDRMELTITRQQDMLLRLDARLSRVEKALGPEFQVQVSDAVEEALRRRGLTN